jgi:site-specific DNA recombinase
MKKAIVYIRVSTDEQADKGYSLRDQREKLLSYAKNNDIEVLEVFEEDYSAKTFNRPDFKKLTAYVKKNKSNIDLLLFTKWDRFSRNTYESHKQIDFFQKQGIDPFAIEQPLDLSVPEQLLMLAVYLSVPEVENKRRSLNVIAGMRRSAKEGRYVGATPMGYISKPDAIGKPLLIPNEFSKSIKLAFELIATGLYSQSDVRRKLEKSSVIISRSSLSRILSNPIYMGFVKSKKYKDEPEQLIKGIHQAIISEDTYLKVQVTTKRRTNTKLANKTGSIEQYPLRGLMLCSKCGKNLTASSSKGNGGKYYYYHCFEGCKNSISTDNVHKTLNGVLSTMSVAEEVKNLYLEEFENEYGIKKKDEKAAKTKSEKKITELKKKLNNVQDLFIEGSLSKEDYNQITERYKLDLAELNSSLEESPTVNQKELKEHITWGFGFVENLSKYYEQGTIEAKRLIIGLMFPEKFTFENNQLQTNLLGDVFLLLCNGSKGLQRIKKRDNSKKLNMSRLVTSLGFKPRTSTAVM